MSDKLEVDEDRLRTADFNSIPKDIHKKTREVVTKMINDIEERSILKKKENNSDQEILSDFENNS